ncbi:hypothetical protein ACLESD_22720 [Pyxidicoccus sp. 3LFB2]
MRDQMPSRWKMPGTWLLGLLALALVLSHRTRLDEVNLYALQADAWLHGRLDVDQGHHDLAHHEAKAWVPFPRSPPCCCCPSSR